MDQGLISQLSFPDERTSPVAHPSWAWRGWTEKQVDAIFHGKYVNAAVGYQALFKCFKNKSNINFIFWGK